MEESIETLGDALPREQARVRKILGHYQETGWARSFGAIMIEQELKNADKAVISGDLTEMIRAYRNLQRIED